MVSTFLLALLTNRRFFVDWSEPIDETDRWKGVFDVIRFLFHKRTVLDPLEYITPPCGLDWHLTPEAERACAQNKADWFEIGPEYDHRFASLTSVESVSHLFSARCVSVSG